MSAGIRITPAMFDVLVDDGTVPGRAMSAGEILLGGVPRGAAIVLTDGAGLGYRAIDAMNSLAEHGYESIAVDPSVMGDVTDRQLVAAVESLVVRLARRGWSRDQIGLVGYELGGRAVLLASAALSLGAAVSVSPTGWSEITDRAPALVTPWLGLFGEDEGDADVLGLRRFAGRVYERSPEYTQVVCYPSAGAQFYRDDHDHTGRAASFDAWQRVLEWFNLRVVPRPSPLAEAWARRVGA